MTFAVGENVGPYRILEQLGQGGMATVYKAYHAALDRYVALKVLHQAFLEDPNFQARFQREARLVARLEHPNIVPIYDYAEHEKRPYLVMKFIEGETLKARLARGPLTTAEITDVIDAVGQALAYAHRQGILHRDIKPSNVLLSKEGVIYLADFGLARIAQAGESTLSSDMIMGTPQYISPEQAMGKRDLDEGTDIYSFGVMLYEMVVGQVPFSADTPFSIIHDHIYSPLPLPRSINPTVPEPVERVLLKALAKERADRYPDVTSMVTAFKQAWVESGRPIQGASVTLPRVPPPPTVVRPAAVPPPSPADAGSVPPDVTPAPVAPAQAEPPVKKKRPAWKWIATAVLLALCCLLGLVAVRSLRNLSDARANARPTLESALPLDEPTPVSPAVEQARRRVAQNPNDPQAHFDLGLAYWDAGLPRPALESVRQAVSLAGENKDFYRVAGEKLIAREAWLGAAMAYLRLAELYQGAAMPPEVTNALHQSVYMAAGHPDFKSYLDFARIASLDPALSLVAQGRHALYAGDVPSAQSFLTQATAAKPDLVEGRLLEAEIYIKQAKPAEARRALNSVINNLASPDWARAFAAELLLRVR